MKTKMIFVFVLTLIILYSPSISHADVIQPGFKEVKISYQITNIVEYPDYVFLIHGTPSPTAEVIDSSPFSFYKLSTVSIYAIPKNNFNEDELKNKEQQLDDFLNNNPKIIKSDMVLKGASKTVTVTDPLDSILITMHIDSINNNVMNIEKSKVIYRYNDGSTAEGTFTDQNSTPKPTKKNTYSWSDYLFYIFLPLLAVLGIALIIVFRWKR